MPKIVATFFASVAFISIMIKLLLDSIHFGATDPIYILKMSFMGAGVLGLIGFYLGRIFEDGQRAVEMGKRYVRPPDKELFLDDILIYDIGVPVKKPEQHAPKDEKTDEQPK